MGTVLHAVQKPVESMEMSYQEFGLGSACCGLAGRTRAARLQSEASEHIQHCSGAASAAI